MSSTVGLIFKTLILKDRARGPNFKYLSHIVSAYKRTENCVILLDYTMVTMILQAPSSEAAAIFEYYVSERYFSQLVDLIMNILHMDLIMNILHMQQQRCRIKIKFKHNRRWMIHLLSLYNKYLHILSSLFTNKQSHITNMSPNIILKRIYMKELRNYSQMQCIICAEERPIFSPDHQHQLIAYCTSPLLGLVDIRGNWLLTESFNITIQEHTKLIL